jgi:hypothetical protein
MRFLRHFQRMWPRFFQTREDRFIDLELERARVGSSVYKPALRRTAERRSARPDLCTRRLLRVVC